MQQQATESLKRPGTKASSPRVAILHDDVVRVDRLRQVLDHLHCRVVDVFPNVSLHELRLLQRDVDLLAIPVDSERRDTLDRLEPLVTSSKGSSAILALAHPKDVGRCLEALRHLGIAGLLATDASFSQIEFRLNGVLDLFPERRQCERARVLLPVEVSAAGVVSEECGVSLSIAGIGIASRRPLEPNSEVDLALHAAVAEEPIALRGRVIHCVQEVTSIPPFRVGVYFLDLSAHVRRQLEGIIAAAG